MRLFFISAALYILFLASCSDNASDRGKLAIQKYGCNSCHMIPGVPNAGATAGPPLDKIATRTYLAGGVLNTPDNLQKWIRKPKSIDPKTAMPALNVTREDTRAIAAYLYTLK